MSVPAVDLTAGTCPLCGSSAIDERCQVSNLHGDEVEIVRCSECALVRRNVGPDRYRYHVDENPITYSEAWAHAKAADLSLPGFETTWRDRVSFALQDFLDGSIERRPRVLEIGCGIGHNLAAFRRYGCEVTGVEPSAAAARFGRERFGLEIVEAYLEDAELGADPFDLVILDSVLEHLPDPVETLASLRPFVASGGRLYIDVPNLESWHGKLLGKSWNIYEPGHINFFTSKTLARTAEAAGLRVIKITTYDGLVTWGRTLRTAASQGLKKFVKKVGTSTSQYEVGDVETDRTGLSARPGLLQPGKRHRIENALSLALGFGLTPLRRLQFRRGGGMDIWLLSEFSDLS